MTSKSKVKGNRVERELVTLAREYGLAAKRAYASDGRSLGFAPTVDLVVGRYKIQAKARKIFPNWITKLANGAVLKIPHMSPKLLLGYCDFLYLVKLQSLSTPVPFSTINALDLQTNRRKISPKWLKEAFDGVDGVVLKANNKDPIILLEYSEFLRLTDLTASMQGKADAAKN